MNALADQMRVGVALGNLGRVTGRRYTEIGDAMAQATPQQVDALVRLARDVEAAVLAAERKGARNFWRHV